MKKINLGCGNDIKKSYINVDAVKHNGVDIIHDLNKTPYPFKADSIDEILAYNVLEHLNDLNKIMDELYRILKTEGVLQIKVPHFSSCFLWADPTHKRGFSYDTFAFYTKDFLTKDNWLSKVKFKILNRKIIWGANKLRKFDFFTSLIKLSPRIYERFFAYLLPSEEIWLTLQKVE